MYDVVGKFEDRPSSKVVFFALSQGRETESGAETIEKGVYKGFTCWTPYSLYFCFSIQQVGAGRRVQSVWLCSVYGESRAGTLEERHTATQFQ